MALSRYQNDGVTQGGKILQTARGVMRIRSAIKAGALVYRVIIVREGERLDKIAGEVYGDGRLWWVIAAASNIGWWMQVPAGTHLRVPTDLGQVIGLV
jgi:nucleoid-associated protein YgaU